MHCLIATDLDGTLLTPDSTISAFTVKTFREHFERGSSFVIATGRHYLDAHHVRGALGIPAHVISSNGARIYTADNRLIDQRNLDAAVAESILRMPLPAECVTNAFTTSEWLIDQECPSLLNLTRKSGFGYRVVRRNELAGETIAKLEFIGEPAILRRFEQTIREQHQDGIEMTYSRPENLELMAKGVSKGVALSTLQERLEVKPSIVMAFGDNLNDVDMLRLVDRPYVMNNANPKLFELLPHATRIGSNAEDAVARTLDAMSL